MAANGVLDFQSTNKLIFRGANANVVIDTQNLSLGVGHQGEGAITSNLFVTGNAHVSTDLSVGGTVTATSFSGGGSALTALNAANIGSGTLPVSRGGTGTTSSTGTGALVLQNAPSFTGDATFDANTLKIDATNNRVGIGTSTPNFGMLSIWTGSTTKAGLSIDRYGSGNYRSEFYQADTGLAIYVGHSTTAPNEKMRITHQGRVGIGTSSPDAKLHVNTSSENHNATDNALIIGGPTACSGNTNLRLGCHTSYAWIQSHCGKPLRLNPGGNTVQYGTGNSTLSDDRIKDNEMYIENATDTLLKLKPQVYDKKIVWNISNLNETANGVGQELNTVRESGLITQDVWYDTPELRHLVVLGKDAFPTTDKPFTDNNPQNDPDYSSWGDEVSTLDYVGLIPYLIKSNQELSNKNSALEARIATLENTLPK